MKYVVLLIGIFFAFVLGYLLEPTMRDAWIAYGEKAKSNEPEEAPEPESEPEPEPVVAIDPEPAPPPEPVEEITETDVTLTEDELREVMTNSIRQAEIGHFTIDQVTEWRGFGEEEIDGETYQSGLIGYTEETVYGERTIEAKALIRRGKVEKWVWTRSGLRIE